MEELMQTFVICPKHGTHANSIVSKINDHKGVWCQICWLESLGPSMPFEERPFKLNEPSVDI